MKKIALIFTFILLMIVPLAGCGYLGNGDALSQLTAWLDNYRNNSLDNNAGDGTDAGGALISLLYPAGRSPNVFTTGWLFGASCTMNGTDYSTQVKWSGTGTFSPDTGTRARPSFNAEGANTITLTVSVDDKVYSRTFSVNAVSPAGYACVGMLAICPAEAHGAPMDPVKVVGPITTGSSHVLVNGKPAARVGDRGVHAVCTGPNTFEITSGDESVLIDGRAAAKIGSITRHCGGMGSIVGNGS
jgi:uncharacterized Zn-binding protein involved in type VI secretion